MSSASYPATKQGIGQNSQGFWIAALCMCHIAFAWVWTLLATDVSSGVRLPKPSHETESTSCSVGCNAAVALRKPCSRRSDRASSIALQICCSRHSRHVRAHHRLPVQTRSCLARQAGPRRAPRCVCSCATCGASTRRAQRCRLRACAHRLCRMARCAATARAAGTCSAWRWRWCTAPAPRAAPGLALHLPLQVRLLVASMLTPAAVQAPLTQLHLL